MLQKSHFFCSSIGKKYLMGITGLVWAGFVLAHMLGNLLLFVGADAYNSYSYALTSGYFIYLAETILVLALVVHVFLAISLTRSNRASKELQYVVRGSRPKGANLASRTMAVQGSLILVFIIYHLITFKFGAYYTTTVNGVVMRDMYKLVAEVFQNPVYVGGYIFCLLLLGVHLKHGFGSIFQSFGLLHKAYQTRIKILSSAYAILVILGFISQPIFVFIVAR